MKARSQSNNIYAILTAILALLLLTNCSSATNTSAQAENLNGWKTPSYAHPLRAEDFRVRCGLLDVLVTGNSKSLFYHNDGTLKTYNEFCKEYDSSGSIIRKK
jgi:hypothetical protein